MLVEGQPVEEEQPAAGEPLGSDTADGPVGSRQLRPHAKVPAVRDFLERAREFVQG